MIRRTVLALAAFLGLGAGLAAAQTAAPAPGATPQKTAPATDLDAKPGTTSDKLRATGGVVRPRGDVDPGMQKPAPQTGETPVLKPGQVPPQSGKGGLY